MDYFRLIDMLPRKMRATLKRDLKCGMLEIKKAPRKEITKIYEDATGDPDYWVNGLTIYYPKDSEKITIYVSSSIYKKSREKFYETLAHEMTHAFQYRKEFEWVCENYDVEYEDNPIEKEAIRNERRIGKILKGGLCEKQV